MTSILIRHTASSYGASPFLRLQTCARLEKSLKYDRGRAVHTNDTLTTSIMADTPGVLTEEYVQNCFHSYLKSALTQAKAERLLDTDVLSSAEGDLMVTGARKLFFILFVH